MVSWITLLRTSNASIEKIFYFAADTAATFFNANPRLVLDIATPIIEDTSATIAKALVSRALSTFTKDELLSWKNYVNHCSISSLPHKFMLHELLWSHNVFWDIVPNDQFFYNSSENKLILYQITPENSKSIPFNQSAYFSRYKISKMDLFVSSALKKRFPKWAVQNICCRHILNPFCTIWESSSKIFHLNQLWILFF